MKENNSTAEKQSVAVQIANTIFGTLAETPNIITKNPRALNMFVSFWYANFYAKCNTNEVFFQSKDLESLYNLLCDHYEGLNAELEAEKNRAFIPANKKTSSNKQFVYQTLTRLYPVVYGEDAPETEENKILLFQDFNVLFTFIKSNIKQYLGFLDSLGKLANPYKNAAFASSSTAPSSAAPASTASQAQSSGGKLSGRQIVGIVLLVLQVLALLGTSISGSLAGAGIFELFGFFIFGIVGLVLLLLPKKQ